MFSPQYHKRQHVETFTAQTDFSKQIRVIWLGAARVLSGVSQKNLVRIWLVLRYGEDRFQPSL
jgi:hypothetical protein